MDVNINGPKILYESSFEVPVLGKIHITETIVNAWIVMAVIILVSIFLTRNLRVKNPSRKQIVAEKLVSMLYSLVETTMGSKFISYAPYIGTLLVFSAISSLSSLTGLRAPTADYNTTLAWALVTFFLIQYNNIKYNGFFGYLKGFTKPVFVMTPLNLISEIANPISLSFRHFGNIASGVVITTLVYSALAALSHAILGFIPNEFIANIPILQVGLPAVLSLYFDVFTSVLQAYIISMLTMVFVSSTAE